MGKIVSFKMPDIGEGVVEGEVIEWLKEVGSPIAKDEAVVVVMTDKATVELPSLVRGRLVKQHYKVGEMAQKGQPLYDVEQEEEGGQEGVKAQTHQPDPIAAPIHPPPPARSLQPPPSTPIKALPKVRHIAKELKIDLAQVPATGKDGRVTEEDLAAFMPHKDHTVSWTGIRALMTKRMEESHQKIATFSYFEQVDVQRLVDMRKKFKDKGDKEGIKVTFMPFFIKALSLSLKAFPLVNSSLLSAHELLIHDAHHIGIAIATERGLIVPVLKSVEELSLHEVIRRYSALIAKAQANQLDALDMKEGTVTITNFGAFAEGGGLFATPVILYPQAAILGLSRIRKAPLVVNDALMIRDTLFLSWTFDHRIIDGELAARFSSHFAKLIKEPALLL